MFSRTHTVSFLSSPKQQDSGMRLPQGKRAIGPDSGFGVDLRLAPSTLAGAILVCWRGAQCSVDWAGALDAITGEGIPRCAVVSAVLSVMKFHLDTRRRQRDRKKGRKRKRLYYKYIIY